MAKVYRIEDIEDNYAFEPLELDCFDDNKENSLSQSFYQQSYSHTEDPVQEPKVLLGEIKSDPDNDDAVISDTEEIYIETTRDKKAKKEEENTDQIKTEKSSDPSEIRSKLRKTVKLPGQPRKPTQAYMLWLNQEGRELIMKENPGCGVTEMAKNAGRKWREMEEDTKKKYEEMYKELKEKYEEEYKEWYETDGKEAIKQAKKDGTIPFGFELEPKWGNRLMKSRKEARKYSKPQKSSDEEENAVNSLMQLDDSGSYICNSPECNSRCKSRAGMRRHVRVMHLNLISYQCEQCDYTAKFGLAVSNHVSSVHKKIVHACQFCDYKTKHKSNIYTHMKYVHRNTEKLQCHLCEFRTFKQRQLNYHIQGRHTQTALQCDQCSFETTWINSLKKHVFRKHGEQTQ
eukprot:GFUD01041539.1.p1 GENE.GFUD01041539.1~~GFUD01041539.1.p1  ORF type:complete len:401 (-),score=96.09 GFUD01041539.1:181-1383(-)